MNILGQTRGRSMRLLLRVAAIMLATLALTACIEDDQQPSGSAWSDSNTNTASTESAGNKAPTISGNPSTEWNAGMSYSFQPAASDPDGDALLFSIENQPAWAEFDSSNGRLSGIPALADVGTYPSIRISASDGQHTASLARFSISVTASADGRVTLTWVAPTENVDGSPLTDLAGFRILFGTTPDSLTETVHVDNPSISTYVVDNLSPATWYFTVKAVSSAGVQSKASNLARKTIS